MGASKDWWSSLKPSNLTGRNFGQIISCGLNTEQASFMEMEKCFYVITFKPAYLELLRGKSLRLQAREESEEAPAQRLIVAITQGGFGQDVVDDERQAKERFLEYLFFSSDLDLARNAEVFDEYFEMEQAGEFVDLDDEI